MTTTPNSSHNVAIDIYRRVQLLELVKSARTSDDALGASPVAQPKTLSAPKPPQPPAAPTPAKPTFSQPAAGLGAGPGAGSNLGTPGATALPAGQGSRMPSLMSAPNAMRSPYQLGPEASDQKQVLLDRMRTNGKLTPEEQQQFRAIQDYESNLARQHPGGFEAGLRAQRPYVPSEDPKHQQWLKTQEELAATQRGIDAKQQEQLANRKNYRSDWFGGIGGQPGRWFGEKVWHPTAETVGTGLGMASLGLQMTGNQMAGAYGHLPMALYGRAREALTSDPNSKDEWRAFGDTAMDNARRAQQTTNDTLGKLQRFETGSVPHAQLAADAKGNQRVEVVTNPVAKLHSDSVDALGPDYANSTMGRISNTAFGLGSAAADAAPKLALPAGVFRAGKMFNAIRSGQGAGQALNTAMQGANVLNPTLSAAPTLTNTLTGLGAAGGAALTANSVANAQGREEQVAAGENLLNNTLAGGFVGNLAGNVLPGMGRAVGRGYERLMYPGQRAVPAAADAAANAAAANAAAAGAVPAATPGVASQILERARAAGGAVGGAVPVVAQQTAIAAPKSFTEAQRIGDQATTDAVTPEQEIQQSQAVHGGSTVDQSFIPPAFAASAAKAMGRDGTGQIGTYGASDPAEVEAAGNQIYEQALQETNNEQIARSIQREFVNRSTVAAKEDAAFYDWMKETGAYRGADGAPGTVEPKALEAGQAAYDRTFAATNSKLEAEVAQRKAYEDTYQSAFRDDQKQQFEAGKADLEKLLASPDTNPQQLEAQANKTFQALIRSNPEGAEDARNYVKYLDGLGADGPANADSQTAAAGQAADAKARQAYVAQAANASPPPADASTNPNSMGNWLGELSSSFDKLGPEAKAAIYIGLPLALVGMLMSATSDEGGGMGGMLLGALGLGVAGIGAAGAGMFGSGAQNAVVDTLGGLGQSMGMLPKSLTPEQKRILTAKDPIQAALASAGGNLTREQAAQRVQEAKTQLGNLKLLRTVGGAMGNGQNRLFENMGLTPEEAALAAKNVGVLTDAYNDPKSQLNEQLQNAEWYADKNKSGWQGWAAEKLGPQNVQSVIDYFTGKQGSANMNMNIAQQIYLQHEMMKAARCWAGYEPVPGKAPYSEDSCRPKGSKKPAKKDKEKKAEQASGASHFSTPEKQPEEVVNNQKPSQEGSKQVKVNPKLPQTGEKLSPAGALMQPGEKAKAN